MSLKAPRGTHDILPNESYQWQYLEAIFRTISGNFGYQEIRTPIFEDVQVFSRTAGETSDIVTKEMYTFEDRGERICALKPEGTAPIVRSILEHSLANSGAPLRLSYITPIFRYERPQKGRYRQAHQVGLEYINSNSPLADAEVIELTYRFYVALGLESIQVNLNSLGRETCRQQYREAVLKHYSSYLSDLEPETMARMEKNPLRLLDSKDPKAVEVRQSAPPILDFLEPDSATHFAAVQKALNEAGVPYAADPSVIRGLDYYSDTVFEISSTKLGAQSALCGGGRYDGLAKQLGGGNLPSVGVGMGIERALIVLAEEGNLPEAPVPDVFIVQLGPEVATTAALIARELRAAGKKVLIDHDQRSLKSQFRMADSSNARFAIVLGSDEISKGVVTLKDLKEGSQSEIALSQVLERI